MRVSDLHDVRTTLCSAIPSTERDPRAFQLIRASGTKHDKKKDLPIADRTWYVACLCLNTLKLQKESKKKLNEFGRALQHNALCDCVIDYCPYSFVKKYLAATASTDENAPFIRSCMGTATEFSLNGHIGTATMAKALKNINDTLPNDIKIVNEDFVSTMTGHSLRVTFINCTGENGASHEEIGVSTKQESKLSTVSKYQKDTLHFSIQAQLKFAKALMPPDQNKLAGFDISTPPDFSPGFIQLSQESDMSTRQSVLSQKHLGSKKRKSLADEKELQPHLSQMEVRSQTTNSTMFNPISSSSTSSINFAPGSIAPGAVINFYVQK